MKCDNLWFFAVMINKNNADFIENIIKAGVQVLLLNSYIMKLFIASS